MKLDTATVADTATPRPRKPCERANPKGCAGRNTVPADSRTGRCRDCYLADVGTNARKTDPEHYRRFIFPMLRSIAKRALKEDIALGLNLLLDIEGLADELADDVGVEMYRRYEADRIERGVKDGAPKRISGDLALERREAWTRDKVYKRWGPNSRAAETRPELAADLTDKNEES